MKRNRHIIVRWGLFCLMCVTCFALQPAWAEDNCNISTTSPEFYAWSENVGWTNWHASFACVAVAPTYLVGYVWAENIGWIKLGHTPWGGGQYSNNASDNWGVNRDSDTGVLSGYGWSENAGWINFSATEHGPGVTMDTVSGKFDGYAWAENVGYIHFQNTPSYYVKQTGALAVDLVSFTAHGFADLVRLEWSTATEIDNAGFHLWRGNRADGFHARITDALIPAEGGPAWGAEYAYEDWDVEPGTTYFYQLEDIDTAGGRTFHGPVSAWPGVANIQAGDRDEPATASGDQPVSVKVAVQAGDYAGTPVEYWLAADTPFGWYSYGAQGWKPGIAPAAVGPLNDVAPLEVVNFPLPPGWYTFYLAVDDQINGQPDLTWMDCVEVEVE